MIHLSLKNGLFSTNDKIPDRLSEIEQKKNKGLSVSTEMCRLNSFILAVCRFFFFTSFWVRNWKTFWCAQVLSHQVYFLIRILNPLVSWKFEESDGVDHVSHFTALSQTYSVLVQKSERASSRGRVGGSDGGRKKKKGWRRRDRSECAHKCARGERGGRSRACKQKMTKNKYICEEGTLRGQKSVGGKSDSCARRRRDERYRENRRKWGMKALNEPEWCH